MSNHDGSYMLSEILHGLAKLDVLKDISLSQRKSIRKLFWNLSWDYDCNWNEIIDADNAMFLAMCAKCERESTELNSDNGYCAKCDQE
jgi:hypothetical protein